MKLSILDFLQYGLRYVYPQVPGAKVRGIPTAHAALPEVVQFYEYMALCDALRVGKAREKKMAIEELKKTLMLKNTLINRAPANPWFESRFQNLIVFLIDDIAIKCLHTSK